MQRAEESTRQFLSPVRALAVVVLLLALAGAGLLRAGAEDDDAAAIGGRVESNNFALINTEAIEKFKELNTLAIKAVQDRDASLLSQVFTPDGPTSKRASREIRRLLADGVIDRTRFQLLETEVITNTADEIQIREVSRLYPCFVTEAGKDVTNSPAIVQETSIWTMRRDATSWLIHQAIVQDDRVVEKQNASCS